MKSEQLTYSHPFRVIDHVGSTPASQNTIAKVKHWMRQCEKDHGCTVDEKYDATPFVPTRLIEVVPDREDVVRLASPTQRVEYIALSYCWGLTRQNTTQKENLELRGKELEVQSLPRTLQDAICMTRAIGLDYLWIDSLCIIQDDKDDWAYEASRMAEIYSHAHLVLVVTAAADCNDGFLHEQADPVMLETKSSEGTPLNVYVRRAVAHHTQLKSFEMERYPLFRRAWW